MRVATRKAGSSEHDHTLSIGSEVMRAERPGTGMKLYTYQGHSKGRLPGLGDFSHDILSMSACLAESFLFRVRSLFASVLEPGRGSESLCGTLSYSYHCWGPDSKGTIY